MLIARCRGISGASARRSCDDEGVLSGSTTCSLPIEFLLSFEAPSNAVRQQQQKHSQLLSYLVVLSSRLQKSLVFGMSFRFVEEGGNCKDIRCSRCRK